MADPIWPATLPQEPFANDDVRYQAMDNQNRSNTEIGPPKVRRRFTAVSDVFTFSIDLTQPELLILRSFVQTTLQDVRRFQWTDWRTMATCRYRFIKRPTEEWMAGYGTKAIWRVTCELERLPG